MLYLENARGDITTRDLPTDTERYLTIFWDLEAIATMPHQFGAFVDDVKSGIQAAYGRQPSDAERS